MTALPMTRDEMDARGWDAVDVVIVTGDAYIDHPSFAAAVIARVLEAAGWRVAMLVQPDWQSAEPWKTFGQPRLAFCVSAGNVDSMVNHYTAMKKRRNDDAYSPNGAGELRPDRATSVYCQRAREAFPGIPLIIGGIEASLRRMSHYDFWSDKVRRSILHDSKADVLVYGNGENAALEIMRRLDAGEAARAIRDIRGTVYRLGASEDLPEETATTTHLPSHEEVAEDSDAGRGFFSKMTRIVHGNTNPYSATTLVQECNLEAVVINPPPLPLSQREMDAIAALPFTRMPHPSYGTTPIPALTVVRDSVIAHRGCFGGCSFCALSLHQGRIIQSRSEASILAEVDQIVGRPGSRGIVSDIGGPTANMYKLGCTDNEQRKTCQRRSCLVPERCEHLATDHHSLRELLEKVRNRDGVRSVFVASGVRTDLALCDPAYIDDLVQHHVGGHLKTAPEHIDANVLRLMNKPPIESHDEFASVFFTAAKRNKCKLDIVPYFMSGLPGATLKSMVAVAEYLAKHDMRPEQVQDFIPTPMTVATSMYYTGLDPFTGKIITTDKGARLRRLQKALLLYHDPARYHDVKSALKEAGREDLIGVLIPKFPTKEQSIRQTSKIRRLKMKDLAEKRRVEAAREARNAEADEHRQPRRDDRPQSDRPRGDWKPRGEGGDRPRSDRPRGDWKPRSEGGERPRSDRPRGDWKPRSEGGERPRSDRPRGDWKPRSEGGERPRSDRPRGDWKPRSEGGDRPRSDRPRGDWKPRSEGGERPRSDRPRGDWKPRGESSDRPSSDRPSSDRPQSDRPRGDWKPRSEGGERPRSDRPRGDWKPRSEGGDRPRSDRPQSDRPRGDWKPRGEGGDRPRSDRPQSDRPRGDWKPRSEGGDRPRSDRPRGDWKPRSEGGERPRSDRPRGDWKPRSEGGDRPRSDRPRGDWKPRSEGGDRPRSDRPQSDRPRGDWKPRSEGGDRPRSDRPRGDWKPRGEGGDRPRSDRPRGDWKPRGEGGDRPRSDRPQSDRPRGDWKPRDSQQGGAPPRKPRFEGEEKRRDDRQRDGG